MKMRTIIAAGFASVAAAFAVSSLAMAQDAKGPNCSLLNIVVPFAPGGGNDTNARAIAPYFQKKLGITTVVQNWPGAGGGIARNRIYTSAPDGCFLATESNFGMAFEFATKSVEYDLERFSYIGSLGRNGRIMLASNESKFTSFQDVLANPAKVGVAGAGSGSHVTTLITAGELGVDWSYVFYDGTSTILAGLLRGEIDLAVVPTEAGVPLVLEGQARGIAAIEPERLARLDSVPSIVELGYPLIATAAGTTSIVYGPPEITEPALTALRQTLAETLSDPEFVAWAAQAGVAFEYGDHEAAKESVVATRRLIEQNKSLLEAK